MDRINYACWSSIYLYDIKGLEEFAPEVYAHFMKGRFTVKHTKTLFSLVASDQALEQSINRSSKDTSGIIGSTKKKEFVAVWNLAYHEILEVDNLFRKITFTAEDFDNPKIHHELSKSCIASSCYV